MLSLWLETLPWPATTATAIVIVCLLWLVRPRRGGRNAPPMVLTSPLVPIPIFGMAIEFGKSPVKMIRRCYEEYGPIYTVPILHKRLTFLVGPEAQKVFCKSNDDVLSQNEVYDFMKPVFGPHVVYDAPKKKRQVQFQSMANGLRAHRLKSYVPKIEYETRLYLKQHWGDDEGTVDLLHALSELTILTASRCLHGNDVRESVFKEVSDLYHDLDQGLTPLTVFFPNAPTQAHLKRNKARQEMVKLFSKVITNRRLNPNASDGTDILSIFMDIKYKDGSSITDEQVTGLLIALLFAGQHTSCMTSTWTTLFIAKHKDIQKRILQEQDHVLGSGEQEQDLSTDKVNEMQLLHDCMREALRLCPPLIMLIRKAMVDIPVQIGKHSYVIPKDDMVLVSPSVGMRLPEVFPNPETFDPDRYGPGREEHKQPYAYMAFGGGMHSCMGQVFGYLQVKTILSILFREYDLEMVSDTMPEIDYEAMVVGPKGDCRVRYKKRNTKVVEQTTTN